MIIPFNDPRSNGERLLDWLNLFRSCGQNLKTLDVEVGGQTASDGATELIESARESIAGALMEILIEAPELSAVATKDAAAEGGR